MSWITAHLMLIGLPALGLPTGALLALAGQWRRSHALRRAGLVVLLAASVLGLVTFAAGRRAAREVNAVQGIDPALVERHEKGAEAARIALIVLALASAGVLVVRGDSGALPWLVGGLAVFGLVATLLVARAALFGSDIRHPELRGPTATAGPAKAP